MAVYLKIFATPQKVLARTRLVCKAPVRKTIEGKQTTPETLKEATGHLRKAQASRQGVRRINPEAAKAKEERVKQTPDRRSENANPKIMTPRKAMHTTGARISQS